MGKRSAMAAVLFFFITGMVAAASGESSGNQKKDPRALVTRIKGTSVEELKKLSFLELNFLKNAVYASKGYKFAEDRQWLNEFFCGKKPVKRGAFAAARSTLSSWMSQLKKETTWDLDMYDFPPCAEGKNLDPDQMKALANIRVALFKKIESYQQINAIDTELDAEFNRIPKESNYAWILGRPVSAEALTVLGKESIRRDVHGYNRMLYLIKNPQSFDGMELLGLYMGDIVFLRQAIEAKYGKPFSGVLGWEISQTIGVKDSKMDYNPGKIPVDVQARLQMLDDIIQKILQSDLDNLPAALKNRAVEFYKPEPLNEEDSGDYGSYNSGAC